MKRPASFEEERVKVLQQIYSRVLTLRDAYVREGEGYAHAVLAQEFIPAVDRAEVTLENIEAARAKVANDLAHLEGL